MKATLIAFLLVGALCIASTLADGSSRNRKEKVDELEVAAEQGDDGGDKVLEKVLMKMLAKMQEDGGEQQEDGDGLAEMQDDEEGDVDQQEGNEEDAMEQDMNKAAEQLSTVRKRCLGRRCFPSTFPLYKLKRLGRKLISFGNTASSLGRRLIILSRTMRSISSSMSSYGRQLTSLGLSMRSIGRQLVYFRYNRG